MLRSLSLPHPCYFIISPSLLPFPLFTLSLSPFTIGLSLPLASLYPSLLLSLSGSFQLNWGLAVRAISVYIYSLGGEGEESVRRVWGEERRGECEEREESGECDERRVWGEKNVRREEERRGSVSLWDKLKTAADSKYRTDGQMTRSTSNNNNLWRRKLDWQHSKCPQQALT